MKCNSDDEVENESSEDEQDSQAKSRNLKAKDLHFQFDLGHDDDREIDEASFANNLDVILRWSLVQSRAPSARRLRLESRACARALTRFTRRTPRASGGEELFR